mgnify:CR=1 FL=1
MLERVGKNYSGVLEGSEFKVGSYPDTSDASACSIISRKEGPSKPGGSCRNNRNVMLEEGGSGENTGTTAMSS